MFNHANNPNVNWENEFQFDDRNQHHINATALQDIKSGDELFIYYGQGSYRYDFNPHTPNRFTP